MGGTGGDDLAWGIDLPEDADDMLSEHLADVSAVVRSRMRECGMTEEQLAGRLGWKEGRLGRVLHGERDLRLSEIATLEVTLGFRVYVPAPPGGRRYRGGHSHDR